MRINGTGCSLVDNLYSPVDFKSAEYIKWTAEAGVQNGIITGGLIFGDDLEASSGVAYNKILDEITGRKLKAEQNIGGPGIVALLHMTQVLDPDKHIIGFYGAIGDDTNGQFISSRLQSFNLDISGYIHSEGITPFTDVLSDTAFHENNGERSFINYIGAAGEISGMDLPESFFDADLLIFGGTALTPGIHDDLSMLLKKAKEKNAITCVNTVYDFRNQKNYPEEVWPLVQNSEDFIFIDLLIMDNEEALRISGKQNKHEAAEFFLKNKVHSGIITHGAEDFTCFSDGSFFKETEIFTMPVSKEAGKAMQRSSAHDADTTGCGDNFAGGVYSSLIDQLSDQTESANYKPSLIEAASYGAVSGGFAGLYKGGVFYEKYKGEKIEKINLLLDSYKKQTGTKNGVIE